MCNGHMGSPCEQTDTCEGITFPKLRWQAVITCCIALWCIKVAIATLDFALLQGSIQDELILV